MNQSFSDLLSENDALQLEGWNKNLIKNIRTCYGAWVPGLYHTRVRSNEILPWRRCFDLPNCTKIRFLKESNSSFPHICHNLIQYYKLLFNSQNCWNFGLQNSSEFLTEMLKIIVKFKQIPDGKFQIPLGNSKCALLFYKYAHFLSTPMFKFKNKGFYKVHPPSISPICPYSFLCLLYLPNLSSNLFEFLVHL